MRRSVLVLLLPYLAGCAALEREPYELSAEQVRPFVEYVERETGYRLDPLPRFIVDRRAMSLAYSGSASAFAFTPFAMTWNGNVYLDHTRLDLSLPRHRSTLVHELVHHGQYLAYRLALAEGPEAERGLRNRMRWECNRSLEVEAYAVQLKWAAENDAETRNEIASVNIGDMAACPRGRRETLFKD